MNTFGTHLRTTVFGESHADCIGVTLDGLPAGTPIDTEAIQAFLSLRAPGKSDTATPRKESDTVEFLSGVRNGKTVGGSVCAIIRNTNTHSGDYAALEGKPRPSHADYPAMVKFGDSFDRRGGGQFSGRLTAPLCIVGGILLPLLEKRGIRIGAHIAAIGSETDTPFDPLTEQTELTEALSRMPFAVIHPTSEKRMKECILRAAAEGDSVGGIIEGKITGLPVGTGCGMFDGVENVLSGALFAIPAVKGVDFGIGFDGASLHGSEYNDAYYYDENGNVRTRTNRVGGICGGMANGMPIVFRTVIKPTPSISRPQETVDLVRQENTTITVGGRHDPCIVPRAVPVVRAVSAMAVYELLMNEERA